MTSSALTAGAAGAGAGALPAFFSAFWESRGFMVGKSMHVPDGVAAGEQHDAAVYADAQAARGRHAVLEGVDEVVVHHAGLVVALGARSSTCLSKRWRWSMGSLSSEKALPISLRQMKSSKRSVRRGSLRAALGQRARRPPGASVMKVGWIERVLHLLVEALVESVAPGGLLAVHVYAGGLGGRDGLRVVC